ncbi:DUF697 domain-containing protein [Roseomonas sp. OT10]|uniref:DUF697 domain-containing protein n=1 Tax=Roseomonas cutis TaxID=2897332 RepID=UPI001E2F7187|nr:DUF697 domain-containing protein [Roseomonas sp. OT10]UFN50819.1 DUF697 domain-containing protein [Roseomonas sp. OT10]
MNGNEEARGPRVILEEPVPPGAVPPRVDLGWDNAVVPVAEPRIGGWSSLSLLATGIASLVVGLSALDAANFVAAQFGRSVWLGAITLVVAAGGFGLILAAGVRELRGLTALEEVDHARAAFAAKDIVRARAEALRWAESVPEARASLPALRAAPDTETLRAHLEAGPLRVLDEKAVTLGRVAAAQAFAATAISPSPAWDALVFGWRGVRLVRQVAALHGLRPGIAGTIALLRRSAFSAATVAATNILADAATRAVVSNPLIEKLAGEAATGAVAARRMLSLARATALACRIVPPPA